MMTAHHAGTDDANAQRLVHERVSSLDGKVSTKRIIVNNTAVCWAAYPEGGAK
jgi:hypothetical protein